MSTLEIHVISSRPGDTETSCDVPSLFDIVLVFASVLPPDLRCNRVAAETNMDGATALSLGSIPSCLVQQRLDTYRIPSWVYA